MPGRQVQSGLEINKIPVAAATRSLRRAMCGQGAGSRKWLKADSCATVTENPSLVGPVLARAGPEVIAIARARAATAAAGADGSSRPAAFIIIGSGHRRASHSPSASFLARRTHRQTESCNSH